MHNSTPYESHAATSPKFAAFNWELDSSQPCTVFDFRPIAKGLTMRQHGAQIYLSFPLRLRSVLQMGWASYGWFSRRFLGRGRRSVCRWVHIGTGTEGVASFSHRRDGRAAEGSADAVPAPHDSGKNRNRGTTAAQRQIVREGTHGQYSSLHARSHRTRTHHPITRCRGCPYGG